jgi:hypothetical protein
MSLPGPNDSATARRAVREPQPSVEPSGQRASALQSWAETIGLPPGGVTLAALGIRPGARPWPGSRLLPD